MPRKRKQKKTAGFSASAPEPIVNIAQARSARQALEPDRKPSIFIAVPSVSGNVHYTIAMAFGRAMASGMMAECPFRFGIHVEPGKRGPEYARNCIVKAFLNETDADWLMMIDEDQCVPENFWQLCVVNDADIVSGLTPVWVGGREAESMLRVNNYGLDDQGQCYNLPTPDESIKLPYRVPIAGTGCIAIRRKVFAPKPHGLGDSPFYFTHMEDQKVRAGEDINFSVDANRAGFIIAVHPAVRFDHVKSLGLWEVERYYHARKAMEDKGLQLTEQQRLSIG